MEIFASARVQDHPHLVAILLKPGTRMYSVVNVSVLKSYELLNERKTLRVIITDGHERDFTT